MKYLNTDFLSFFLFPSSKFIPFLLFFLSRLLFLFQFLCNLMHLVYSFPFISCVPNSPSPHVPPSYFCIPNPLLIHSLTPLIFYLLCSSLSLILLCSCPRTFFHISVHCRFFSFLLVTILLSCPDLHVVSSGFETYGRHLKDFQAMRTEPCCILLNRRVYTR